jgi:putative uncharacterized protein (fragment)
MMFLGHDMAERPVFKVVKGVGSPIQVKSVEFQWFPGLSLSQKRKSVESLHANAKELLGVGRVLEVSTKSPQGGGVDGAIFSAFNLGFVTQKGVVVRSVEGAYQGSKVFKKGGPFPDLFGMSPRDARKDRRLVEHGALRGFRFCGQDWDLTPGTAFYDWLYINALNKNRDLAIKALDFDAFTDIEFNPERQRSCQARSIALFVSLYRRGMITLGTPIGKEDFLEMVRKLKVYARDESEGGVGEQLRLV